MTSCRHSRARDSDGTVNLSASDSLLLNNRSSFLRLREAGTNRSRLLNSSVTGVLPLLSSTLTSNGDNSSLPQDNERHEVVSPPANSDEQTPTTMKEKPESHADDRNRSGSDIPGLEYQPPQSSGKRNDTADMLQASPTHGNGSDSSRSELSPVSFTTASPEQSNLQLQQNGQSRTGNDGSSNLDVKPKDDNMHLMAPPMGEQPSLTGGTPSDKVAAEPSQVDNRAGSGNLTSGSRLQPSESGSLQDTVESSSNKSESRNISGLKDAGIFSQNTAEDAINRNMPGNLPAPLPRSVQITVDNSTMMSAGGTSGDQQLDGVHGRINSVPGTNSSLSASEIPGGLDERNVPAVDSNDSAVVGGMKDTKELGKMGSLGVREIQPSNGTATNGNMSVGDTRTKTGLVMARGEDYRREEVVSSADAGKLGDLGQQSMAESRVQPRVEEGTPVKGSERQLTENEQREIPVSDHEQSRLQFLVSVDTLVGSL